MKKLTLNSFVDYVLRSNKSKKNFVRNYKNKGDYKPEQDFYKPLRSCIIRICKKNKSTDEFDSMFDKLKDDRKKKVYVTFINSAKLFLENKHYSWIEPERIALNINGLDIIVNPELGFIIDDKKYFVKLYLKKEKIKQEKRELLLNIMQQTYKNYSEEINVAVLDLRDGVLYTANREISVKVGDKVDLEAENWIKIWQELEEEENH